MSVVHFHQIARESLRRCIWTLHSGPDVADQVEDDETGPRSPVVSFSSVHDEVMTDHRATMTHPTGKVSLFELLVVDENGVRVRREFAGGGRATSFDCVNASPVQGGRVELVHFAELLNRLLCGRFVDYPVRVVRN